MLVAVRARPAVQIRERIKNLKMRINKYTIYGQAYFLPFIKITHDIILNGEYELIVGWLNIEISLSYKPQYLRDQRRKMNQNKEHEQIKTN